ncbi:MAG: helix-turn-helix transcriptional regulator [Clostridia bacterium]|nr:helix-turn-helix transcriptional regulator [Clostridia bacterium]
MSKVYTDKLGVKYSFKTNGFCDAMEKFRTEHAARYKSTTSVMEYLADNLDLSVDAIKHWKNGHNGPSDFETIEKIADLLEVDVKLIARKSHRDMDLYPDMSEESIEVVRYVYNKILEVYADYLSRFDQYTDDKTQNDEIDKKSFAKLSSDLFKIHGYIFGHSCSLSYFDRCKLQKILHEAELFPLGNSDLLDEDLWGSNYMSTGLLESVKVVLSTNSRDEAIKKLNFQYIMYEESAANDLLYKYEDVPDELYSEYDQLDLSFYKSKPDLSKFHVKEPADKNIIPVRFIALQIVYKFLHGMFGIFFPQCGFGGSYTALEILEDMVAERDLGKKKGE